MGEKKRILVADDEEILRDMMMEFCEEIGVVGIPAENGEDALKKAAAERPDAVVVDNRMPDMSGLDVISRIKADDGLREIPVLLLSGDAKLVEAEARARGARGVMLKPVTRASFRQALEACLGKF